MGPRLPAQLEVASAILEPAPNRRARRCFDEAALFHTALAAAVAVRAAIVAVAACASANDTIAVAVAATARATISCSVWATAHAAHSK